MSKLLVILSLGLAIALWDKSNVLADGPYHGRVIDKETKKPIEGAAVLAVWWKRTAMIGHPMESVHDVQEVVSDSDGNFTIPGTSTFSLNPFSRIDEPKFTIFKPGFKAYYGILAPTVEGTPTGLYEKDGKMIAALQELKTREERLRNLRTISVSSRVPEDKYRVLIKLRDIEEESLGLPTRRPGRGAKP
jgi:hypothetical protein